MNLDWHRLKAVVLESDDWGLCAWVPDEPAYHALEGAPAWRTEAGRLYGRSTLERAEDVGRLEQTLCSFRGGDGFPPVLQANTVMATPDFARLTPPGFACEELPLVAYPEFPSRWARPGLGAAVRQAVAAGVWWPELHGLLHLPRAAWLAALRRGAQDACRALEQQCLVCEAVEASAEYDPAEPPALRRESITRAVGGFRACFGRAPGSLCAPDYLWDEALEADAERLGVTIVQGRAEQRPHPFPRLRHLLHRYRWPDARGRRFYMPPRIAFEPRGGRDPSGRVGVGAAHRAARRAWVRAQPAIVSTHRLNYAHLDPAWMEAGCAALRDLLALLAADGATFLTDAEARALKERSWSVRPVGERGALLRYHGAPRQAVRFPAPPGVADVALAQPGGSARITLERPAAAAAAGVETGVEVVAEVDPGAYLLEWRRA